MHAVRSLTLSGNLYLRSQGPESTPVHMTVLHAYLYRLRNLYKMSDCYKNVNINNFDDVTN